MWLCDILSGEMFDFLLFEVGFVVFDRVEVVFVFGVEYDL